MSAHPNRQFQARVLEQLCYREETINHKLEEGKWITKQVEIRKLLQNIWKNTELDSYLSPWTKVNPRFILYSTNIH